LDVVAVSQAEARQIYAKTNWRLVAISISEAGDIGLEEEFKAFFVGSDEDKDEPPESYNVWVEFTDEAVKVVDGGKAGLLNRKDMLSNEIEAGPAVIHNLSLELN